MLIFIFTQLYKQRENISKRQVKNTNKTTDMVTDLYGFLLDDEDFFVFAVQ